MSCFTAVEQAEARLKEAKANENAHLAAAALGEDDGGLSIADAEAELARVKNDRSIARSTRDALQGRLQREHAEVERTKRALSEAAVTVLKTEMPVARMLAEARDLQDKLIARRLLLRDLFHANCVGDADVTAVENFLRSPELPAGAGATEWRCFDDHPTAGKIATALEQLRADAAAPLPIRVCLPWGSSAQATRARFRGVHRDPASTPKRAALLPAFAASSGRRRRVSPTDLRVRRRRPTDLHR